jgi:hypothetical protein
MSHKKKVKAISHFSFSNSYFSDTYLKQKVNRGQNP